MRNRCKWTSWPLAAGFALFLTGCDALQGGQNDPNAEFNAGYAESSNITALEGVWASQGYGYYLDITANTFQLFDAVEGYCNANSDFAGPVEALAPFRLSQDGNTIRITPDDPAYQFTLDKIENLPASCTNPAIVTPTFVFDVFDRLFRDHYAFFETRNVDWPSLIEAARTQIHDDMSEAELFDVLASLANAIDDGHVSLTAEIDGEVRRARPGQGKTFSRVVELGKAQGLSRQEAGAQWRRHYGENIQTRILDDEGLVTGNNRIRYGLIDDNIGYIAILVEGGYGSDDDHAEIEKILNEIIPTFADVDAVILDLSINHGGHDGVSRQIARRFAKDQTLAYSKIAGDSDKAVAQNILLRPNNSPSYHGLVYVLTSDHTVSAGEILVMSLRALPNVTHIGEATRGALSDILVKPLPNGWTLGLSNEIYRDHEGLLWEGKGIPPEIEMSVFDQNDPTQGHVEAVEKVVKIIRDVPH